MYSPNNEMNILIKWLAKENIPFEVVPFLLDGEPSIQICYPNMKHCLLDAVSHKFSYGGPAGLIEMMGEGECEPLTDYDVKGWLTAEEAFVIFLKAFRKEFED